MYLQHPRLAYLDGNRIAACAKSAYWGAVYANGMSLEAIAEEFATQPETLASYPEDASNLKFVSDVYQNAFDQAPDIEGLRWWLDELNDGNVGRGEAILAMLNGVRDGSSDRDYLDQRPIWVHSSRYIAACPTRMMQHRSWRFLTAAKTACRTRSMRSMRSIQQRWTAKTAIS